MSALLCIPRIDSNVSKDYIMNTLGKLDIGYVEKFTEIPLKNNPSFKRILLRFRWNENNKNIGDIKKRLSNNEAIKLVYNMPWYWKIVESQQIK